MQKNSGQTLRRARTATLWFTENRRFGGSSGPACRDVQSSAGRCGIDKHYFEKHVPIAKRLPGLKKYEISQGPVATPGGPSGYHLVATLQFDDMTGDPKRIRKR
jgi:hypothetical protein